MINTSSSNSQDPTLYFVDMTPVMLDDGPALMLGRMRIKLGCDGRVQVISFNPQYRSGMSPSDRCRLVAFLNTASQWYQGRYRCAEYGRLGAAELWGLLTSVSHMYNTASRFRNAGA